MSLLGPVGVESPYYHCRGGCGCGRRTRDEMLGLGRGELTPAAEEVTAMVGVLCSFGEGSERVLRKVAGLRVSESTVERTTEGAGERVGERLASGDGLGPSGSWRWHRDAEGRRCAYVSVDATGIAQQGPGGVRREGRMAYVGMVYNAAGPASRGEERGGASREVRYLAGFYELSELGRQLQREALRVGWAEADQQIAISDGANGLEEFFRTYFPKAECILDFWHAKEYLVELGQALYPSDESGRRRWTEEACHRLKHEGGAAVRAMLEGLEVSSASAEAREVHRRTVQYYRNHEHRMDYPRYLRHGWQISSGPVESACKTVVGNRLKGGGMRWGEAGADAVCHLRALYLSEPCCWDSFWDPPPN